MDGITKSDYGRDLQKNLENLALRIKRGSYKPRPKREVLIPKANGKTRPIAVACFEDKLVDAVIMKILSSIYDSSFIRSSFGFRPKKSAHQAIKTSYKALEKGERPYVVEVDFSNFFNTIPHGKLLEVLREKVADEKLLILIKRFLEGKVMKKNGTAEKCVCGTPQGGLMSPVLANIYLDMVLDKWFLKNYKSGIIIRYADDAIFLFGEKHRAEQFLRDFKNRVECHGLIVNEEKSRSLSFKKTQSNEFNFLGFTFYWGIQNKRKFLKVKTEKQKLLKSFREFYDWIKTERSVKRTNELWETAKSKIRGHYEYFGFWMNRRKLVHFYKEAVKALCQWPNRRGQKRSYSWDEFQRRIKNHPLGKPPERAKLKPLGKRFGHVF